MIISKHDLKQSQKQHICYRVQRGEEGSDLMLLRGKLEPLKNRGKSSLIQLGLFGFACLFVVLSVCSFVCLNNMKSLFGFIYAGVCKEIYCFFRFIRN